MKLIEKQSNELIYMASPYSHPQIAVREERFEEACEATAILFQLGRIVFSPIAHTHPLVKYGLPEGDWEFYEENDLAVLRRCTSLMVLELPGWSESKGVAAEIRAARILSVPEWHSSLGFLQGELREYKVVHGQAFT